jgi:phytoene dehydrogenase-like protein
MSVPDYALVLTALHPEALWSLLENDLGTLVWDETNADDAPTQAELDAAWPQVQHELEHARIEAERRARYQAETDGLYFAAMREDTPNLAAWTAAVDQIKADLPYPPEVNK